jgi:hypothetical protein
MSMYLVVATVAAVVLTASGAAAQNDPLFPQLDCFEEVSETEVRLHIGVTNLSDQEITDPAVNVLEVEDNAIPSPTIFKPGYVPRVYSITIAASSNLTWELGQQDYPLYVDMNTLEPDRRCANQEGPQGPEGPEGPVGPQGPAGESAGALLPLCRLVTASLAEGIGRELTVSCNSDESLVQGGGSCNRGNMKGSMQTGATSWRIECRSTKGIQGSALCCPTD